MARLVFFLMREHGVSYDELSWRSGLLKSTLKSWRVEKFPSLRSIEAALGALGWGLAPYPKLETLPADASEMAEELGQHFFADDHALAAAVAAAISQPAARGSASNPAPRLQYRQPCSVEAVA
jgi:hypothetical protein